MSEGFSKEQIRKILKENNLKDGKSIADFLKNSFGSFIQEALENEMDTELGYTHYDYKEKENQKTKNSRNAHHKKLYVLTLKMSKSLCHKTLKANLNR